MVIRNARRWFHSLLRPTPTRYAVPSLRGLVEIERRECHPWTKVYPLRHGVWAVCDENGNRTRDDHGRPMRLHLGSWGGTIAYKAQRRWFRNQLTNGHFRCSEKNRGCRLLDVAFGVHSFFCCGVFLFPVIWNLGGGRGRNDWSGMLNDHPGLFVTAAFLYLLLPALFVALGSWLIWMGIKSAHPRRLNFDEEGITFDLRDGSQVRQPWNELYSVDRFGFLRFLDGRKFRVLPGPRGFRILRAAQDAFIKPPVPRDVCRRMAWRWGVLSVVVAGFAALASYVLPEGDRGLHPALIVTLVLAVTMGLGATAIMAEVGCVDPLSRYLFRKSAAFERRNHRKRMAKLRRASLTSDVRAD